MKQEIKFIFTLVVATCLSSPSLAQERGETLKKIKATGTLSIGYRDRTVPFSYIDDKKNVIGYSYDFATRIGDAIKLDLKLAKLNINPVPITVQNRFSMVQNGAIDIECTSTTNNAERRKELAFSNTIFIVGTRLMTRKDSGIKDFSDLAGKTVVVPALTTSEVLLSKLNAEKNYQMNIIRTIDRSVSALATMQAGQADAYMHDDAILYGQIANAWRPEEWMVTGTPQSREAYGCMMRKNDPAFKKLVDDAIARVMQSGEADKLYKKWFLSPIPPNGTNLGFAMDEAMVHLYKNPNDKSFD